MSTQTKQVNMCLHHGVERFLAFLDEQHTHSPIPSSAILGLIAEWSKPLRHGLMSARDAQNDAEFANNVAQLMNQAVDADQIYEYLEYVDSCTGLLSRPLL